MNSEEIYELLSMWEYEINLNRIKNNRVDEEIVERICRRENRDRERFNSLNLTVVATNDYK